jgi:hypothetical protein
MACKRLRVRFPLAPSHTSQPSGFLLIIERFQFNSGCSHLVHAGESPLVGEPFLHSGRAGFDPLVPYFNSTHARVAQPVAAAALETVQCGFDSHPAHSQEHGVTAAHSADYRRVPVQIWVFLLCGIRLTEKMLGFHPKDRGSTPLPRTL